jgi:hypothetical protein
VIAVTFNEYVDLVEVLKWPAVVVILVVFALVLFRAPIADLLGRIRSGSVGPGGARFECEGRWPSYNPDAELATPIEQTDPAPQGDETDDTGDESEEDGD